MNPERRLAVSPSRRTMLATGTAAVALALAGWYAPEVPAAASAGPGRVPAGRRGAAPFSPAPSRFAEPAQAAAHNAVGGRKPAVQEHAAQVRVARRPLYPTPSWARRWDHAVRSVGDFQQHCPDLPRLPDNGVLLTVDDGPDPYWTPRYLALFQEHGVQATFCLIGRNVARHPEIVRAIYRHGHSIANHTYDHPETLPSAAPAFIRSQILRTQQAIEHATGNKLVPHVYRAPGGAWGQAVFAELAREQLVPLWWDVDPADWSRPGRTHIVKEMLTARAGDIILCHDGGGDRSQTYVALQGVVPALQHRGLKFVTFPV